MSLRDYFTAQIVAPIVHSDLNSNEPSVDAAKIAQAAYALANAMLAERTVIDRK